MNRFLTFLFCFLIISHTAQAQQRELKSGLNYTTLGQSKTKKAAPAKETTEEAVSNEQEYKEESPEARVWNKYKKLATGQVSEEKATEDGPKKPELPEKPEVKKTTLNSKNEPEQKQQNAFGAILQEWRSSKDSKKEMKSRSFKTPETAKPATP